MDWFVGYRSVTLADPFGETSFPMAVLYPTATPERPEMLGPFGVDIARDAPPVRGVFPLVLISHGSGGSHLVYRTLAHHLVRHGFVVGVPEHPFNNRRDNTLQGTAENLANRPRHLRLAADWFFDHPEFVAIVRPGGVSLIGHSMGGYTALAAAGGVPTSFPYETPGRRPRRIDVPTDLRVNALVLLAPGTVWFREAGALNNVRVPILMLIGEKDVYTPANDHASIVLDGVPDRSNIEFRIVPNAGHFAFLSQFPASMTKPEFAPSQDPEGFDRVRFHHELNADILAFLRRATAA